MIVQLRADGLDWPRLHAVMHYPRDEARRRELEAVLAVEHLRQADVPVPGDLVDDLIDVLLDAPPRKAVLKALHGDHCLLAGAVLLAWIWLDLPHGCKEAQPSHRKAVDWVRKAYPAEKLSRRTVDRYWYTYRSVAHLWAARYEALMSGQARGEPWDPLENAGMFALAAAMQRAYAEKVGIDLDDPVEILHPDGTPFRHARSLEDDIAEHGPPLVFTSRDLAFLKSFRGHTKR